MAERWQDRAACRGAPLEWFVPPDGVRGTARRKLEQRAKNICAGCPVAAECLADAETVADAWAVRGGLTPAERGWRHTGKRATRLPCNECGTPYTRQQPTQLHCSPSCAAKARQRAKRRAAA